jgi:hypothetical protein
VINVIAVRLLVTRRNLALSSAFELPISVDTAELPAVLVGSPGGRALIALLVIVSFAVSLLGMVLTRAPLVA